MVTYWLISFSWHKLLYVDCSPLYWMQHDRLCQIMLARFQLSPRFLFLLKWINTALVLYWTKWWCFPTLCLHPLVYIGLPLHTLPHFSPPPQNLVLFQCLRSTSWCFMWQRNLKELFTYTLKQLFVHQPEPVLPLHSTLKAFHKLPTIQLWRCWKDSTLPLLNNMLSFHH